jgi:hypothetical protein
MGRVTGYGKSGGLYGGHFDVNGIRRKFKYIGQFSKADDATKKAKEYRAKGYYARVMKFSTYKNRKFPQSAFLYVRKK